ncbi:DUF805 domain-containing protein [Selenomonadales bacterium OttesenSCG-928-I06]|nr:DUF805 domain-containing protein [Selenomonadales bacterium OttesenSCG-928-I06]
MSLNNSKNIFLKHLFSFSGRINRKYYVFYILLWTVTLQLIGLICNTYVDPYSLRLYWLMSAMSFISILALQVKRTHDLGWSTYMPIAFYLVITFVTFSFYPNPQTMFSPYTADNNIESLTITQYNSLASLIYTIWFFILVCLPGVKGPNKYGPDPNGNPAPTNSQNQNNQDRQ